MVWMVENEEGLSRNFNKVVTYFVFGTTKSYKNIEGVMNPAGLVESLVAEMSLNCVI